MKEIVIIGGPNGAGKTTTARTLLPAFFSEYEFLNADEIARDLNSLDVQAAAFAACKVLLGRMKGLIAQGESFALETTCSGKSFIPILRRCVESGWEITFYYFWLPDPEMSIQRVANRVRQGGHNIPSEVIYRRFQTGLWNMRHLYLPIAKTAAIYDNSDKARVLIAKRENGAELEVLDQKRWARIEELT